MGIEAGSPVQFAYFGVTVIVMFNEEVTERGNAGVNENALVGSGVVIVLRLLPLAIPVSVLQLPSEIIQVNSSVPAPSAYDSVSADKRNMGTLYVLGVADSGMKLLHTSIAP